LGPSPEVLNLLKLCEQPRTIIELMNSMQWKNRTKFRNKYITPLISQRILSMTIPDKPQSSKQKYFISEYGRKVLKEL